MDKYPKTWWENTFLLYMCRIRKVCCIVEALGLLMYYYLMHLNGNWAHLKNFRVRVEIATMGGALIILNLLSYKIYQVMDLAW
jgi:hypothetical protein